MCPHLKINLQEAVVDPPYVAFAVRQDPGVWEFVQVSSENLSVEPITSTDYLKFKERIFDENWYAISLITLFLKV